MSRRDSPRSGGGARRESADEVLERRYRRLLAWYPAAYRAANEDDMLGVALASPRPGSAARAGRGGQPGRVRYRRAACRDLRRPDQRATAAVMATPGLF
jgi:hypothetical protein